MPQSKERHTEYMRKWRASHNPPKLSKARGTYLELEIQRLNHCLEVALNK